MSKNILKDPVTFFLSPEDGRNRFLQNIGTIFETAWHTKPENHKLDTGVRTSDLTERNDASVA